LKIYSAPLEQTDKLIFNAFEMKGKGSVLTEKGEVEMDAIIINGTDLSTGIDINQPELNLLIVTQLFILLRLAYMQCIRDISLQELLLV